MSYDYFIFSRLNTKQINMSEYYNMMNKKVKIITVNTMLLVLSLSYLMYHSHHNIHNY